jgi:5-methylcytosine-specific restriction endonuclease McrA
MPWSSARKDPAYGSAEWKRARLACLRAARWRCQIRLPGVCIGTASEADHILGLARDPHHTQLRATCRPCHQQVTAKQASDAKRRGSDPDFNSPRTKW